MTKNASFIWKIVYLVAIAVLLLPLYYFGAPSTFSATAPSVDSDETDEEDLEIEDNAGSLSQGGLLAQMRTEHKLSQTSLGGIDPASETMRLATFGLRGVAANRLWMMANEYKKKHNYDQFRATLNQIVKIQPNYVKVWDFQAHNLSYNVSVEFDDYRHRYQWVRKGIDFLITGTQYNEDNPQLLGTVGWYLGQKFGRADEKMQFRQLYREDDDFHQHLAKHVDMYSMNKPYDNWLTGKLWNLKAQVVVDTKQVPIRGKSPLHFHVQPVMSQVNYAEGLYDDFPPSEQAREAWAKAGREFAVYAKRSIPTSWGHTLTLGSSKETQEYIESKHAELDKLAPGVRDSILAERRKELSPEELEAVDTPPGERTFEQFRMAEEAQPKLAVSATEIAERAPSGKVREARQIADTIASQQQYLSRVVSYRRQVNLDYWEVRCKAEGEPIMLEARDAVYQAKDLLKKANPDEAREKFEYAWTKYAELFDKYPSLLDTITSEDIVSKDIMAYRRTLESLGEEFPEDFVLNNLIELQESQNPDLIQMRHQFESVKGTGRE